MPRLVISTVGTSLITNQVRERSDQKDLQKLLIETSNYTQDKIIAKYPDHEDFLGYIDILKQRAEEKLKNGNTLEIREASAELNGIYGLYENKLENGKLDVHYLITTATEQGQVTAKLLKNYLHGKVNYVDIFTPEKLSTETTTNFTKGIDDLLEWLRKTVKEHKNYDVYFNLVGGFKALQGYMNTIGMFYADKIIYLFEGSQSNLITIPRLPIDVDKSKLKEHIVTLALLDAGDGLSPDKTSNVHESLVAEIDGKMILSNWGNLIWNECKEEFLSQDLLDLPRNRIFYERWFQEDYKKIKSAKEREKLQETLAKVAYLLEESNGNTQPLGKAVSYYEYGGTKDKKGQGIDHFYVGIEWRVSCQVSGGLLKLRHYGTHNYVETKELKNKK